MVPIGTSEIVLVESVFREKSAGALVTLADPDADGTVSLTGHAAPAAHELLQSMGPLGLDSLPRWGRRHQEHVEL